MASNVSLWANATSLAVVGAFVSADASTAWQGTLFDVHFMQNGIVLVYTSGSRSGIPGCGQSQPQRFAFDSTTPAGRSQLAGILAADAAKRPVVIVGTGTCSVYGDSETISYFYIDD